MDDIGDIIYYLAILVITILSSFFNKKKKKQETIEPKPQKVNPWKDIKEEFEKIREEFEQKEKIEKEIVIEKTPIGSFETTEKPLEILETSEVFSYDKIVNNNISPIQEESFNTEKHSFSDDIKSNDIFNSDKIETNNIIQFEDTEDIRKAIIYNEILNPKYL